MQLMGADVELACIGVRALDLYSQCSLRPINVRAMPSDQY